MLGITEDSNLVLPIFFLKFWHFMVEDKLIWVMWWVLYFFSSCVKFDWQGFEDREMKLHLKVNVFQSFTNTAKSQIKIT